MVEVGFLRALNGDDGSELFTVDQTSPVDLRVNTACSVATGDIDLDGLPEIVTCDASGSRLIAFEDDGTFKWRSVSLAAINWGAPAIADLDENGVVQYGDQPPAKIKTTKLGDAVAPKPVPVRVPAHASELDDAVQKRDLERVRELTRDGTEISQDALRMAAVDNEPKNSGAAASGP